MSIFEGIQRSGGTNSSILCLRNRQTRVLTQ